MKKNILYGVYIIVGLALWFYVPLAHSEMIEWSPNLVTNGVTAYFQTLNTPSLNSNSSGTTVTQITIGGKTFSGESVYGVSSTATVDLNQPVNIVYLKASSLGGTSLYATNDGLQTGYLYRTKLIVVQNATGTGGLGWCDPLFDMKAGVSPVTSTTAHAADWYNLEVSGVGVSVFVTMTAAGRSAP